MIRLSPQNIGPEDIDAMCRWLKRRPIPQLTKGPLTIQFERAWSEYVKCKYSLFVNSGSSAILLMCALFVGRINKRIVIPSLAWSTTLSSPCFMGFEPYLCDCNLADLSVDLKHLEQLFRRIRPGFLMLVHVLGLVPRMRAIKSLCLQYGVTLLEDACEAAGSATRNRKVGTFGELSAFSLYYGHQITTIEGGMLCTNNRHHYERLLMMRSHGWDRDLPDDRKSLLRRRFDVGTFEALYRFYEPGFNLRATDLQAFVGWRQLKRLPSVIRARQARFTLYNKAIRNNLLSLRADNKDTTSLFAYPVAAKNRRKIVARLHDCGVETRPIAAGSLSRQPCWAGKFGTAGLANCEMIDKYGFYLPAHQDVTRANIKMIAEIVNDLA